MMNGAVIAGFFTVRTSHYSTVFYASANLPDTVSLTLTSTQGGSLAVRGGFKAARNSAIGCGILLAVIEGVGIGIQRMMAENTRLDVSLSFLPHLRIPSHPTLEPTIPDVI